MSPLDGRPDGEDIRDRLARAAAYLALSRQRWQESVHQAKAIAREAHAAGMTEVDIALALGVDRPRTLRRWLGK